MRNCLSAGSPIRHGAVPDRLGTNFTLVTHHAERVELCLFDVSGAETQRIRLPERTGDTWHGHVAGIVAGQRYGYRVSGAFDPANGHRFNANKLLVDPYARAIDRPFRLAASMFGHVTGHPDKDLSFDATDSAPDVPKAIVLDALNPPAGARPRISWQDTIVYELHVKGQTQRLAGVPEALRGTLPGLAQPAALDYLAGLGVTTLELLPIAAFIDERHLAPLGLRNYWGYNPVTFLAPDPRYVGGDSIDALQRAVERIHAAGLEVILDVVFNHTGESDELGPTVGFRGIDNALYYRLKAGAPRFYDNVTGCGNTVAVERPPVLRLVMDAMRHWVSSIGVDGFRFDLATTLARSETGFDANGPFLAALRQDPILADVKLIAEPWDIGPGGYRGGGFPPGVAEWNDRFRDDVRRFWQGNSAGVGRLASGLAGSSDRFQPGLRRPSDSINYVTAHDGFTLADLISYAQKHNEPNGEHGADGTNENISWNHGVEGDSDDPAIVAARQGDVRALLATLLLSRGTPMLRGGDELGQSQAGNNNAYAQDNETTWIDWEGARDHAALANFVRRAIALRKAHLALHRNRFLTGRPADGSSRADAIWRSEDGRELRDPDWNDPSRCFLGLELYDPGSDDAPAEDHVYLIVNGGGDLSVTLPSATGRWRVALNSADVSVTDYQTGATLKVPARSVVVLVDALAAMPLDDPAKVEALARLAGIEPEHRDANGRDHVVSLDTKRSLLAAMNLPAGTPSDVRASLASLEDASWRGPLPPVAIAGAGEELVIEVCVDGTEAARIFGATLALENGERIELRFRPSEATPIAARRVSGILREKWRVPTGRSLPPGLHRVETDGWTGLMVAAPKCSWQPDAFPARKTWGIAANLYSTRSDRDWGIGDFSTLQDLAAQTVQRGGALVGINPLHALFPDRPDHISPYYPSDRRFLESAYIDPTTLPDYVGLAADDPWFAKAEGEAATLRAASLIDYPAVFRLKDQAFRKLWARFRESHAAPSDPFIAAFRRFVAEAGDSLLQFAKFESGKDAPEDEVQYRLFLQWQADRSLAAAAGNALAIGLYRDLAVGPAPYGAEAHLCREAFASGISVGAPPDPYSDIGQVWGIPPFNPRALGSMRFGPWIDLVRANMRHAGALRLDHVMGLERLLWVPEGASAAEGGYVRNDSRALLAILAVESHRRRCLVVGEDLGTVPSGFRERMAEAGLFSMSVMLFERDGAGFNSTRTYRSQSIASFGTHDLPPLLGWWQDHRQDAQGAAFADIVAKEAGTMLDADTAADALSVAVHSALGRSSAGIALAQFDDLAGEQRPVNIPGTTSEYPNWRRRTTKTVRDVLASESVTSAIEAVSKDRRTD